MGFADMIKRKKKWEGADHAVTIKAAVNGKVIPLDQIQDDVFSQGIMGPGCGIEPEDGRICAPVSGKVVYIADTRHAIGLETADGTEILIHIGIDTVNLKGEGFLNHVQAESQVQQGQLLMEADLGKIREAGYLSTVVMLVTNLAPDRKLELIGEENIRQGEAIMRRKP